MAERNPSDDPEQQSPSPASEEGAEEDEPASTPFDNPFFLPLVLLGFAGWFIYDGWFNPDMEWIRFNRVLGVIFVILGLYQTAGALGYTHPAVLPVLLFGFAGWFAYDGAFNPELATWSAWVNLGAAAGCALLAVYRIVRARREEAEETGASGASGSASSGTG